MYPIVSTIRIYQVLALMVDGSAIEAVNNEACEAEYRCDVTRTPVQRCDIDAF